MTCARSILFPHGSPGAFHCVSHRVRNQRTAASNPGPIGLSAQDLDTSGPGGEIRFQPRHGCGGSTGRNGSRDGPVLLAWDWDGTAFGNELTGAALPNGWRHAPLLGPAAPAPSKGLSPKTLSGVVNAPNRVFGNRTLPFPATTLASSWVSRCVC